jgi:hypothetical protein
MDITPDKQNIDRVFSNTVYHIDFYQRDYKWTEEPVQRLLDDIFYKFNETYCERITLTPSAENVTAYYPWYYLNTFVTNTVDGRVYVVDGQQRLTTLTLILIRLSQLADVFQSKTKNWLQAKLVGYSGMESQFWMNHERHEQVLKGLLYAPNETIDVSTGITAVNMKRNYQVVVAYLDTQLKTQHKLETFAFYFLHRLVLINLTVVQTDVPMVFEVINDRGVRLKPYEILKGKLLGQIDKLELKQKDYNGLWERHMAAVNNLKMDEADAFFRYLLKAKFANTRKEGLPFDGDYHREMFSSGLDENLKLNHNPLGVKNFLEGQFRYYSTLYVKLFNAAQTQTEKTPHLFFNGLNELDTQFLLILSACTLNDPEEDIKTRHVAQELDRAFSLLQLQSTYDSNGFAEMIYEISTDIREKPVTQLRVVFDRQIKAFISKQRNSQVSEVFQYTLFRNTGMNLNARFKRYFFARVEQFLAAEMCVNMKHSIQDLVTRTGYKTGFHIEHILARNEENIAIFEGDEERFELERNRLGGLLLLKGRDNISSNNETYSQKLASYAGTLHWNELLREDSYKSKLDVRDLQKKLKESLVAMPAFGQEQLEQRHRLLFEISQLIWEA